MRTKTLASLVPVAVTSRLLASVSSAFLLVSFPRTSTSSLQKPGGPLTSPRLHPLYLNISFDLRDDRKASLLHLCCV